MKLQSLVHLVEHVPDSDCLYINSKCTFHPLVSVNYTLIFPTDLNQKTTEDLDAWITYIMS